MELMDIDSPFEQPNVVVDDQQLVIPKQEKLKIKLKYEEV